MEGYEQYFQSNHLCNITKSPLVERDPCGRCPGERVRTDSTAWNEHLLPCRSVGKKGILPCIRKLCKLKVAKILNVPTVIWVKLPNLIGHWEYLSALMGIGTRQASLIEEDVLFWRIGDMQLQKKKKALRVRQDMRKEHLPKTGFDSKRCSSTIIEMQKHHCRSSQIHVQCCTKVWKCLHCVPVCMQCFSASRER